MELETGTDPSLLQGILAGCLLRVILRGVCRSSRHIWSWPHQVDKSINKETANNIKYKPKIAIN